jgi:hypothetical protein
MANGHLEFIRDMTGKQIPEKMKRKRKPNGIVIIPNLESDKATKAQTARV